MFRPALPFAWVRALTGFDEAHGFAVNLLAVAALALIGAAFLTGRQRLVRPALIGFMALCLADWVLIEDFGFFGGLGTDPNSMIPFILLAVSGYLTLTPETAPAAEGATPAVTTGCRDGVRPISVRRLVAAASFRAVVARCAWADHPRRSPDGGGAGQRGRQYHPGAVTLPRRVGEQHGLSIVADRSAPIRSRRLAAA